MTPFKLNGPVGADFDHDLNDVRKTKDALRNLGHFRTPDYGQTSYPDQPMFDGIKKFQKARGLKPDGIMKPGGETEHALAKDLKHTGSVDAANRETTSVDREDAAAAKPVGRLSSKSNQLSEFGPPFSLGQSRDGEAGAPWWRSPKLGRVSVSADTANQRTTDYLQTVSGQGDLPKLYADSIRTDGQKAIAEFADLLRKVELNDPGRAAKFALEVKAALNGEDAGSPGPVPETPPVRQRANAGDRQEVNSASPPADVEVAAAPIGAAIPWAVSSGLAAAVTAGVITSEQEKRYREALAQGGETMQEALNDISALMQRVKPGAIKGNVSMPRTDVADPPPPVPPSEPENDDEKPDKTESLVQSLFPPDGMPLPSPKEINEKLEGYPDKVKGIAQILILESRGSPKIQGRNAYVLKRLMEEVNDRETVDKVRHLSGAWSEEEKRLNEKRRGPKNGVRAVRADGEIETKMKDGTTRRDALQTADTYADGERLKPHEADAVERLKFYLVQDEVAGDVLALAKLSHLSDEEFQKISDPKIVEYVDRNFGTKRKSRKAK